MKEKEMIFKPIMLKDILPIEDTSGYKIHTGQREAINVFLDWVEAMEKGKPNKETPWYEWQTRSTKGMKDYRNESLVLTLAELNEGEDHVYIFAGIFKVKVLPESEKVVFANGNEYPYSSELTPYGANFIGRLKVATSKSMRRVRVNLDTHYEALEVVEVLPEIYKLP